MYIFVRLLRIFHISLAYTYPFVYYILHPRCDTDGSRRRHAFCSALPQFWHFTIDASMVPADNGMVHTDLASM